MKLGAKIFTFSEGEISKLIETPFGYSIYRCNKVSQNPDLGNEIELGERSDLAARDPGLLLEGK